MNVLVIDKHVDRHEHINTLLSAEFPSAELCIISNLKGYTNDLASNDLILVHVGNSVDYNIVFKKSLESIVIYYTGQYDIVEVEGNSIYSSYKLLKSAILEAGKLI